MTQWLHMRLPRSIERYIPYAPTAELCATHSHVVHPFFSQPEAYDRSPLQGSDGAQCTPWALRTSSDGARRTTGRRVVPLVAGRGYTLVCADDGVVVSLAILPTVPPSQVRESSHSQSPRAAHCIDALEEKCVHVLCQKQVIDRALSVGGLACGRGSRRRMRAKT